MFYFDPTYLLWVALPAMLLSLLVQGRLKSTFAKWSRVPNSERYTGMQVAQMIFNRTSLNTIPLEPTAGALTDHYDPRANVVRLSEPVCTQPSVASMAIAAHELGHVQQYQTGSPMIAARSFLLPALQFTPTISYMAFMLGFALSLVGLMWIGVFFFGVVVVFSLLTVPIEIDASRRGLKLLEDAGLLDTPEERQGARQMLGAAGWTYIAAAATSLMQLLYYVSLVKRSGRSRY
ncbi:MAG: zinc metallopeptidase [Cyanobacteria bacterium J069]|nr:MAG: zinc metallopeptidase [Cyanobacteria bacterium J069]